MADILIFDTDVLIWAERGNEKAADLIDQTATRRISVQTYMELLQRAKDKRQHLRTKQMLRELNFLTLPLSENIGHRAAIYIEEYSLGNGMEVGDAIIAATAVEHDLTLVSANKKHFTHISELKLKIFTV